MVTAVRDAAPGRLEVVRSLLNTWVIPNETRVGTDRLAELGRDAGQWATTLPALRRPTVGSEMEELRQTRDGLRALVDHPAADADAIAWLASAVERHTVIVRPELVSERLTARVQSKDPIDASGVVLASVLDAVRDETWPKLKSCLDCRWVFYDHSRSGTRTWCGMNATGPNGRACGSIAKVRAYRKRQAPQHR